MNILNIAWKEMKTAFRDTRTLFFMMAFPIVLMLILGTALSNEFDTRLPVADMHVLYKDETKNEYFQQFITEAKQVGIQFEEATEKADGEEAVKQGTYDGYVEATEEGLQLYVNNRSGVEGNIVQGMLASFVDQYNIANEIVKIAPNGLAAAMERDRQQDFIEEVSLISDKQPSSMDYYAIVITTMIVLYGAMSASRLIPEERVRKTADRLVVAPVRRSEIFIGKVLGSLVSNSLCILLVVLVSKLVFQANWGEQLGIVCLMLLTEIIFAVSMGLGISFLTKTNAAPSILITLFVQLSAFFGGAYVKIENPEGMLEIITNVSPLTWMNTGLMKFIYANDASAVLPAVAIHLTGAGLFLLVAIISLQRREGL